MLSLLYKEQTNSNWIEDETIITYSGCLNDDSKCFSNRQYKFTGDGKETQFDVRNPCKFPFKDRDDTNSSDKTYNSCKWNKSKRYFWCATSVDADLEWQTRAFCSELCHNEGM